MRDTVKNYNKNTITAVEQEERLLKVKMRFLVIIRSKMIIITII